MVENKDANLCVRGRNNVCVQHGQVMEDCEQDKREEQTALVENQQGEED